jgi:preprotein translocase subunit SecG
MSFVIGLLTVVLVLDCIALMFLILIQLPKKEAGLGLAFGGGAADALFGAGSGTVMTKATKYAASIFFALAIGLGVLQSNFHRKSGSEFQKAVEQQTKQPSGLVLPPGTPTVPASTTNAFGTNAVGPPARTALTPEAPVPAQGPTSATPVVPRPAAPASNAPPAPK